MVCGLFCADFEWYKIYERGSQRQFRIKSSSGTFQEIRIAERPFSTSCSVLTASSPIFRLLHIPFDTIFARIPFALLISSLLLDHTWRALQSPPKSSTASAPTRSATCASIACIRQLREEKSRRESHDTFRQEKEHPLCKSTVI